MLMLMLMLMLFLARLRLELFITRPGLMLFKDTMMLLLKRTKASKTPLLKLRILLLRSKSSLNKIKALTITTSLS